MLDWKSKFFYSLIDRLPIALGYLFCISLFLALKEMEFQSIYTDVTGKILDSHQQLFNKYLRKINMELSYVQFQLRACRNQYDSGVYYGVINTIADEQSKLGSKYTVPQISFYKGIIEAIVQDQTTQDYIGRIEKISPVMERAGKRIRKATIQYERCSPTRNKKQKANYLRLHQLSKTSIGIYTDNYCCNKPTNTKPERIHQQFTSSRLSWFKQLNKSTPTTIEDLILTISSIFNKYNEDNTKSRFTCQASVTKIVPNRIWYCHMPKLPKKNYSCKKEIYQSSFVKMMALYLSQLSCTVSTPSLLTKAKTQGQFSLTKS